MKSMFKRLKWLKYHDASGEFIGWFTTFDCITINVKDNCTEVLLPEISNATWVFSSIRLINKRKPSVKTERLIVDKLIEELNVTKDELLDRASMSLTIATRCKDAATELRQAFYGDA